MVLKWLANYIISGGRCNGRSPTGEECRHVKRHFGDRLMHSLVQTGADATTARLHLLRDTQVRVVGTGLFRDYFLKTS